MHRNLSLHVVLVAATLIGSSAWAQTASANELSTSEDRIVMVWEDSSERLTISVAVSVECEVDVLANLTGTVIEKFVGWPIGDMSVISMAEGGCNGGFASPLSVFVEGSLRYDSFSGSLPWIQDLRVEFEGLALEIETALGPHCLLEADNIDPVGGEFVLSGSTIVAFAPDPDVLIQIRDTVDSDPFLGLDCEDIGYATLSGTAEVESFGGGSVSLSLI